VAAKTLAVLGTMSSVGKSLLTALVSYHFSQKGLKVFPFKAQNMSLNAFATDEGELAHAQVFQAWAAGRSPSVSMNPLLLKPLGNMKSEIIFLGKSQGILPSGDFRKFKAAYKEKIWHIFEEILLENDLIVLEGAGGLAELNLLENDFVNYEIIKRYQIPFLLVGDIDRGGIFAQIWGTYELVPELKQFSLGFVINKFRGEESLFKEGIAILEEKTGLPCLGLLPYLPESLFEEDSASLGLPRGRFVTDGLRIAVVYYPHISNYLDFDPFRAEKDVEVLLIEDPRELEKAHAIILPGSKNTLASLAYLEKKGLAGALKDLAEEKIIVGLCGGFQLLGTRIEDHGIESEGSKNALGLLPHVTLFKAEKIARASKAFFELPFFRGEIAGFEIRYGRSFLNGQEVIVGAHENVFGTYLHGVFYNDDFRFAFLNFLRKKFKLPLLEKTSFVSFFQEKLANICAKKPFANFLKNLEKSLYP